MQHKKTSQAKIPLHGLFFISSHVFTCSPIFIVGLFECFFGVFVAFRLFKRVESNESLHEQLRWFLFWRLLHLLQT